MRTILELVTLIPGAKVNASFAVPNLCTKKRTTKKATEIGIIE